MAHCILFYTGRGEDAIGIAELKMSVYTGESSALLKPATPEFSVYPNPTDGIVNIDNPSGEGYNCEIYSLSGKKVFAQQNVSGSTIQVDLGGFSKGLYIITIHTAETTVRQKVIIH